GFESASATTAAIATTALAAKQAVEPLIEIAPQLIEIGRAIVRPTVALIVLLLVTSGAAAPVWIVQREFESEFFFQGNEHSDSVWDPLEIVWVEAWRISASPRDARAPLPWGVRRGQALRARRRPVVANQGPIRFGR